MAMLYGKNSAVTAWIGYGWVVLVAITFLPSLTMADEGGVSVWLPGQYGSLAAVPAEPGWSLPLTYYHAHADAGIGKTFERGGKFAAGLDVHSDLLLLAPTYVFSDSVAGGQAALRITGLFGNAEVAADATLAGPRGFFVLSRNDSDALTAVGDLYPFASLRWNLGPHNLMTYTMLGVPVGGYKVGQLANLGTNHWSIDAGGGYTYLDSYGGHEFSLVGGFTYNFENPDTNYRNGTSGHLDWGLSQFFSERLHVGLVGYFYQQLDGDSGSGAVLGDFKSRVNAIGPQIGYLFKLGRRQAYLNLKGYQEYGAKYRPEGFNIWLTFSMPLDAAAQLGYVHNANNVGSFSRN